MKRAPLVFAALVPFLATAGGSDSLQKQVDVQKLEDDVGLTEVIGADVQSRAGEDVGDVDDVMLTSDGRIESVLINRDSIADVDVEEDAATADARVGATDDDIEMTSDTEDAGSMLTDEDVQRVQWSQISYNQEDEVVRLSGQDSSRMTGTSSADTRASAQQTTSTMAGSDDRGTAGARVGATTGMADANSGMSSGSGETYRASDVIGMEVNLADEESFGEVEEVLINSDTGNASAIVVDAWEGFDKQRYALPVNLESVNEEEETLTVQYSEEEVDQLEEYENHE